MGTECCFHFVAGDFNGWNESANVMEQISPGIWEAVIDGINIYDCYKYVITAADGRILYKADPYGFHSETRPGTASKVYELGSYKWKDAEWQKESLSGNILEKPVNIYEMHFGSWKRRKTETFILTVKWQTSFCPM